VTAPLLRIEDLRVSFATRQGPVQALHGISLSVSPGETLGIVGESGSGKSVTAMAAMRLLDRAGRITSGRIAFRDTDIVAAPERVLRRLRGAAMSMIFQNPRAALNPIRSVGLQIADALRAHRALSAADARREALALLEQVKIRDAVRRLDAYPHELSGGMCQRIMIAMAIACDPALLIADEPTTGLDVTTQKAVMDLLSQITRDRHMALLLITHDLALAAQYCQRVTVMQHGRIVETAPPAELFSAPTHAYTRALVAASPTATSTLRPHAAASPIGKTLLSVEHLGKTYADGTVAVADVSFTVAAGESLGLVGESGSGKTTISRMVCRLVDASLGRIMLDGDDIGAIPAADFHRSPWRSAVQIVFQDAGESLNPRFTAFDSIADPLRRLGPTRSREIAARVAECADRAGLPTALLHRFPHQLSGGQKARVGIARALAIRPRLLVLDEPTAALDVSVQAIILDLLDSLRRDEGLSYLFVSHDLNVVRMLCERVLVLQHGRVVEQGTTTEVFARPTAAYTAELIASIPQYAGARVTEAVPTGN
jgi:peptide/nickel transport system ATP-binding protein